MPTRAEKIPNRALNGQELKEVVITEAERLLGDTEEKLMVALRHRMNQDSVFSAQYGHPRVSVELSLKFHWTNMHLPATEFRVLAGEETDRAKDAVHFLDHTERLLTVDNPNLTRMHVGLPINVTEVERPKPGEIIGTIRQVEVPVEPTDYPKPTAPVDTNKTSEYVTALHIPDEKLIQRRRRS